MPDLTRKKNYCLRGMTEDGQIRFWIADTTDICLESARRHNTSAAVTIALGRLLTGTLLMGLMLKDNESTTVQVVGDGLLGSMTAVADAYGHVRGFSEQTVIKYPENWHSSQDVGFAVGNGGTFAVAKDLGLKEPYSARMPLVSGEINDEFAYYFSSSEQIPTFVAINVLLDDHANMIAAGGCFAQVMPGAGDDAIDRIEKNLDSMPDYADLLSQKTPPEKIAELLFKDMPWKVLDTIDVFYTCNCDQDKFTDILYSLGEEELQDVLEKQGTAEIICSFCEKPYLFEKDDIQEIIDDLRQRKQESQTEQ